VPRRNLGPRSSNHRPASDPPPARGGWVRREAGPDDDAEWIVRSVSGSAATKAYRCPGCSQEIATGTPHVVAWPADEPEGSVERRHWHTGCWRRGRPRG
jgi:hypothetical protein